MPPVSRVNVSTAAYGVLLLILAVTSSPQTMGDAGEYLGYAARFVRGAGPIVDAREVPQLRQDLAAIDPGLAHWDVDAAMHVDRSGGRHFVHFWVYPALATPFVMLASALHLDLRSGFTMLHAVLLVLAFPVVARCAGSVIAWLLLAGPIVWWLDKPHPEVFLFSMLSIAFAFWRDRPVVSAVCAGLAAAQVGPFAILVPAILTTALVDRPDRRRDRRFWIGASAAVAVTLLAPVFYLWRFGEISPLTRLSTAQWPWAHFGTELFDLTIGLIPNWPLFGAAVTAAVAIVAISRPRELGRLDAISAAAATIVLLFVFPRIGNVTHGATPGLSRYGLWLVPFALPLMMAARGLWSWQRISLALAVVSVPYSLVMFHPARPEFSHRPTSLAQWVWRHHPGWSTPLPRVFVNALRAPDETAPVATSGCTKALLIGRGESQGMWPRACMPAPVPSECRTPGALCYANRDVASYAFTPATSEQARFTYDPDRVWPKNAEPGVSAAMSFAGWPDLQSTSGGIAAALDRVEGARIEVAMERDDRLFMVLRHVAAGARVHVHPRVPSHVQLVDGESGQVIQALPTADGPTVVTVNEMRTTVVLAMRGQR
jgi:hypothetical protein